MSTAAFVLALLALVVSVISVSWQVWTWRYGGPVVKVTTSLGFTIDDPGLEFIVITVSNAGRSPVTVTGYGLALPDKGGNFVPVRPLPITPRLPHRLEAGADASFHLLRDEVRGTVAKNCGGTADLRAFATLGTGQTARAKKPLRVEAHTQ